MDKTVLVIKTNMFLKRKTLEELYDKFLLQIEKGLVIIPAYCEGQVLQVPEGVEVRIEACNDSISGFLDKPFNLKGV